MDEEIIEFSYNPPGPKRGDFVEVVATLEIPSMPRKFPNNVVGMSGTVVRTQFGADGNRWIRVEFREVGRYDFITSELKKAKKKK